jgi:hypothetical protein
MDVSSSTWLVILLALAGANLPFINERLMALVSINKSEKSGSPQQPWRKPLALGLLDMIILYFIVGALSVGLEARIGNAFTQTWEFYAITGCLFLVLGFPGFVVRYLRK